jgi:hypothetical protein
VLADLAEVGHQLRIAGIEADSHPGEVRSLGQRVDGDDTVQAVLEDRPLPSYPGELAVALVAEDRDVVGPTPRRRPLQVVERPRRVAGAVGPERERPCRVGVVDVVEAEPERAVDGDGNSATTGEDRAHLVRRVGDRRVEDGIPVGPAEPEPLRQRAHELLRTDARRDLGARHVDVEPAAEPPLRRVAEGVAADARRISPFGIGRRERGDDRRCRWVARRADRQVDHATGKRLRDRHERIQAVVRVRRRHEAR